MPITFRKAHPDEFQKVLQFLKEAAYWLKEKGVDIALERPDGTIHFMRDNFGILVELMPSEWE